MKRVGCLLGLVMFASPGSALEVDPYRAWMHQIEDSTALLNQFINETARETIEEANLKPAKFDTCAAVTIRIFRRNHTSMATSKRLLRHIHRNPDIDRFGRSHFEEVHDSMYRYVPQLYVSSLADSINVDGIYMSDDKMAHFFGFGRRYYRKYLAALRDGMDTDAAVDKAIRYGMRNENGVVGKLIDGIFSHADLEANFQGLQMARSFCEGTNPNIVGEPGNWRWHHDTDIADYVLPTFDEGFHGNQYIRIYWPAIRKRLRQYCEIENLPFVAARLADYRARDSMTLSREYVAKHVELNKFEHDCRLFDSAKSTPR
jgi:hypothetical protein